MVLVVQVFSKIPLPRAIKVYSGASTTRTAWGRGGRDFYKLPTRMRAMTLLENIVPLVPPVPIN